MLQNVISLFSESRLKESYVGIARFKMTLRTLTLSKEAKFALAFFEIDKTFSVLETKKLQTETYGCDKERGTKVKVKSGQDVYEAEIIAVNGKHKFFLKLFSFTAARL